MHSKLVAGCPATKIIFEDTRADVGIAIGSGTDVAIESAGIILVQSNPLVTIFELSRATGYNVFALPLTAGVLAPLGIVLSPAIGAVLMSLGTIVVAINAQLLRGVGKSSRSVSWGKAIREATGTWDRSDMLLHLRSKLNTVLCPRAMCRSQSSNFAVKYQCCVTRLCVSRTSSALVTVPLGVLTTISADEVLENFRCSKSTRFTSTSWLLNNIQNVFPVRLTSDPDPGGNPLPTQARVKNPVFVTVYVASIG